MVSKGVEMLSNAPPKSPPHLALLASLHSPLSPKLSIPLFEQSLKLSAAPSGPTWDNLAECYHAAGDLPSALAAFNRSGTVRGVRSASLIHRLSGDHAESLSSARDALRRSLSEGSGSSEVERCWSCLGNAQIASYFASPPSSPSDFAGLANALKALDKAGMSDPDSWYNKACVFTHLERFTDAISAYSRAGELDPHGLDADARRRKVEVRKGGERRGGW